MSTTTPINGLPSPDDNSPNDPPIHFTALAAQLDTRLVPQFATATARNSAISSPIDGMMCAVAGVPLIYRSGAWRGITNTAVVTGEFYASTNPNDNKEYGVSKHLTFPDPGYPYIAEIYALVNVAADANTQARVRLRLDAPADVSVATQVGVNVDRSPLFPAGQTLPLPVGIFDTAILTGAHDVVVTVQRVFGTGSWSVAAAGNWLRATLRPV